MSITSLCSQHSVAVATKTSTIGLAGSQAFTWPTAATYRGYKRELNSTEVLDNQTRGYQTTHRVYFASEPTINNGDQMTVDGEILYAVGKLVHKKCGGLRFWYIDAVESESR